MNRMSFDYFNEDTLRESREEWYRHDDLALEEQARHIEEEKRRGHSTEVIGGAAPLQWLCWRCREALDEDGFCSACGGGYRKPSVAA